MWKRLKPEEERETHVAQKEEPVVNAVEEKQPIEPRFERKPTPAKERIINIGKSVSIKGELIERTSLRCGWAARCREQDSGISQVPLRSEWRHPMSKLNGDRARFHKDRKRRLLKRARLQVMLAGLATRPKAAQPAARPDHDLRKGAMEEDRPGPKRSSHPGLDGNGMPSDANAIAQDRLGAQDDQSQG